MDVKAGYRWYINDGSVRKVSIVAIANDTERFSKEKMVIFRDHETDSIHALSETAFLAIMTPKDTFLEDLYQVVYDKNGVYVSRILHAADIELLDKYKKDLTVVLPNLPGKKTFKYSQFEIKKCPDVVLLDPLSVCRIYESDEFNIIRSFIIQAESKNAVTFY